jgi:hypothetical protein
MLRLAAIIIFFSSANDVALAQSLQVRMASFTSGTQRQSFTPRDNYRRYSDANTGCADNRQVAPRRVATVRAPRVSNVSFMEMAACVSEVSTRPAQVMAVGMTDTRLF